LPRKTRLSTRNAVHMGVVFEVLAPGVQDGHEPDLGPEVLRVGGDLLQGLGGGFEQDPVDLPRVLQGDWAEHRRERIYLFGRDFLAGLLSVTSLCSISSIYSGRVVCSDSRGALCSAGISAARARDKESSR
jgi:hypothetical protein